MIKTIKDLKEIIQNLPDDMEVMGYKGGYLWCISHWIISETTLTDEEKRDGYPNGVIPTFVLSVD